MNGWTGEKTVINEKMISRFPSPFSFESFDALASESLSLFYLDHLWKYSFGSVLTLIQKRAMKSYGWTKFEPIQVNVQGRFTGTKPDAALQRLCVCAVVYTLCVSIVIRVIDYPRSLAGGQIYLLHHISLTISLSASVCLHRLPSHPPFVRLNGSVYVCVSRCLVCLCAEVCVMCDLAALRCLCVFISILLMEVNFKWWHPNSFLLHVNKLW